MCRKEQSVFSDVEAYELVLSGSLFRQSKKSSIRRQEPVYAEGETNIMPAPSFFQKTRPARIEILEGKKLLMHLFETTQETNRA